MKHVFEQKVTLRNLIKFTLPTICMMVFMSLYSIVDGAFVSNLIGTNALSAINLTMPFINLLLGVSIMMASGGCAIVMTKIGEKKEENARQDFTLIVITTLIVGIVITTLSIVFLSPIIKALGATELVFDYCKDYLFFVIIFTIPTLLKFVMEQFMVAAGKSKLALLSTILGGIINIILDYIFIAVFDMGIKGAAIATGIGYTLPCIIGFVFFYSKKNILYFTKPKWNFNMLINTCINGSSEMLSSVSSGIITFLFNKAMLNYLGEDGVAAITIILYAQFLLSAVYMGYSMGVAPMISYYYGGEKTDKLRKLMKNSFLFVGSISVTIVIISMMTATSLVGVFARAGTDVYIIALNGFRLFIINFLFVGVNIYICGMFTALSNGKVSAFLSIVRTLVLVLIGIMVLPMFFDVNGIWLSIPFAESIAIIISILLYMRYKPIYKY